MTKGPRPRKPLKTVFFLLRPGYLTQHLEGVENWKSLLIVVLKKSGKSLEVCTQNEELKIMNLWKKFKKSSENVSTKIQRCL